ncbi:MULTISPECIES: glycosyltransferase family 2 protein [Ramlibacter]|uniref:Glycosyltransferase family 2 protein n=1 Tax=Ramlibacter aquaticus TaxID=2780094 RepID=A0ABR9SAQ7_9BURK|nr:MULTISPECIES: glycosyltransferase family 2 protein [Ramlibacter]MBE7939433.1 glycosyltransferase family 2 protein [Ramlibacter aquaticus]
MPETELTVLMPCLNEARTVAQCVQAARDFLQRHGVAGEVLVADNGSEDGSQAIAQAAGARVVPVPRRGYGAALLAGVQAAQGRYVIIGDADASYDFSALADYLARLRAGAQLVMGNRFKGGIAPGAMPFLHRYLGNPVLSFIGRLFFRTPIRDFHCGLRGFSREAMLRLGLITPGMEFASEMVAKAALGGLRIEEVPTTLRPDGRDRPPHLRTWRDGWRHLRFLLLFCPRWLFLYPGVGLFLAGALGLVLGLAGPAVTQPLHLGIHTLLFLGGATLLGVQFIIFALLTKWLAVLAGLVPQPGWMQRWASQFTLENGLLLGLASFIVGLAWSLWLTVDWVRAGFGPLDPVETMRSAIPAVTLMAAGMQVGIASFFAGALHFCWRSARS